jgi:hypothetical protein
MKTRSFSFLSIVLVTCFLAGCTQKEQDVRPVEANTVESVAKKLYEDPLYKQIARLLDAEKEERLALLRTYRKDKDRTGFKAAIASHPLLQKNKAVLQQLTRELFNRHKREWKRDAVEMKQVFSRMAEWSATYARLLYGSVRVDPTCASYCESWYNMLLQDNFNLYLNAMFYCDSDRYFCRENCVGMVPPGSPPFWLEDCQVGCDNVHYDCNTQAGNELGANDSSALEIYNDCIAACPE